MLKDPRVWGLALLLFGLGYSTYITLYIRSGLNPIIDENDPENWKNFMLFLKREQYGSESMMLGIFERKAAFWDYQLWTMYFKYFFGQFPVPGLRFVSDAFRKATGPEVFSVQVSVVPYLLGAWGIWTHWRQDVRRFWAMVLLFVLTGIGLCVYLNMPDPQPRERDYVFVGSFAVFAVWIGMAAGDLVKHLSALNKTVVAGIAAVLFLVMPGGLAVAHYPTHDRTGDYIAYDYAFNTLMSCDRNAILFTNGDNDTFPLWFMQEVMAVRKDVRVVNLSLLNTGWYIKQLRDQVPHLPVEYTDTYIDDMLTAYTRTAIIQSGRYWPEDREVQAAGISWLIPGAPAKLLRVQDVMVLKLIDWNAWQRPVYFSITVPESNQLHLGDHLAMEGMVFRLVAGKAQVIHSDVTRKFVMETYRYRGIADPDFYRSETANNLVSNYLACFLQLAEADVAEGRMEAAYKVARYCEEVAVAPENWQGYMLLAGLMHRMDRPDEVQRLVRRVRTSSVLDQETRLGVVGEGQMQFAQYDSAVVVYTEMIQEKINIEVALYNRGVSLEKLGRLEDALQDMQTLSQRSPGDAEVEKAIEFIRAKIQYRDQMESNK